MRKIILAVIHHEEVEVEANVIREKFLENPNDIIVTPVQPLESLVKDDSLPTLKNLKDLCNLVRLKDERINLLECKLHHANNQLNSKSYEEYRYNKLEPYIRGVGGWEQFCRVIMGNIRPRPDNHTLDSELPEVEPRKINVTIKD